MTQEEMALYNSLRDSNSLELAPGAAPSVSKGIGAALAGIVGNPPFKAEINLNISVTYYSQAAAGTPVGVAAAALQAAQKTKYPVYLFGQADRASNFRRARQLVPAGGGWDTTRIAVFNGGSSEQAVFYPDAANPTTAYAVGSIVNNLVLPGDLLIVVPQTGWVAAAAATTQVAEVLIRCTNVGYTTLLDSLSSDLITLNMIRYTVDPTQTAQLANQIEPIYQSLFGKAANDSIDPQAFITGGTYNPNISDIPITLPIDKNLVIATLGNYDVVSFSWTLTVARIDPLTNRPGRVK